MVRPLSDRWIVCSGRLVRRIVGDKRAGHRVSVVEYYSIGARVGELSRRELADCY